MKFALSTIIAFVAVVSAAVIDEPAIVQKRQNNGRPVPNGACCVANTSLKQDVCNVNGQTGRCVPASVNNCKPYERNDTPSPTHLVCVTMSGQQLTTTLQIRQRATHLH
jgi:hypothetical protein